MTNEEYRRCSTECEYYDPHTFSSCSYNDSSEPEFVPEGARCKYHLKDKDLKQKPYRFSQADISFLFTAF